MLKAVPQVFEYPMCVCVRTCIRACLCCVIHIVFLCSGVPAVVDFATMREAVKDLGGDPVKINPLCLADLVIDHSVQVDIARRYPHI